MSTETHHEHGHGEHGHDPDHSHAHEHEHEHNDEAELFPRVLTTRLVGDQEAARDRRHRLQTIVLGIGLGVLALGLPLDQALSLRTWSSPLTDAVASALAGALDLPRERIGFLASAAFLALAVPLLVRLLRSIGFDHELALPATLVGVLSPLGCLTALTAGDFYLGVVLATWLAHELFAGASDRRVITVYAIGAALHADVLALLPAAIVSRTGPRPDGEPRRGSPWTVGALGGAVALAVVALRVEGPVPFRLPEELGFGILLAPLVLGTAAIGLVAPWVRTSREVSRPPRWCLVFLLVPCLATAVDPLARGSWLLPVAALGLADFAQQASGEGRWKRRLLPLVGIQLVLSAASLWLFGFTYQLHDQWRWFVREALEPSDLVVTDDPWSRYYLSERWRLEVLSGEDEDLTERVGAARSAGRRIVVQVEDAQGDGMTPPQLTGPVYRLTRDRLEPPEAAPERRQ